MIDFSQQKQYQVMHGMLNERQWRLYVATEAKRRGPGGISQVAREAEVTRKMIRKGLQELEAGDLYEPGGRIRRKGGGRKQAIVKDATLSSDLEALLEPKGEQPHLVQWTTKSRSKLKEALKSQGHTMGETAIRERLKGMGVSRHPRTRRRLREPYMPTETPNFSTSIAPGKLLKRQASR